MPRRFLICLAFATWCVLDTWVEYAESGAAYFARYDPIRAVVLPVVCLEFVLALAMLGAWEFCRRRGLVCSLPLHFLFLALCLAPLGIASVAALAVLPFNLAPAIRTPWFWPIALTAALVPIGLLCLRPRLASRAMRSLLLYSWPVLILVFVQAARVTLLAYPHSAYADGPLAAPLESGAGQRRVVWIIFDELSQTIVFGNRPPGLELPNFDRLRAGAFYASSAASPGGSTEISMPSLILGEQVVDSIPDGPDDLRVRLGSPARSAAFGSLPNVFDDARQFRRNTAVVGWFHPYGRLLNRSLTKCFWTAGWLLPGIEEPTNPQSLSSAIWRRAQLQFAALPLMGHLPGVFPGVYQRREKIARYSLLRDHAIAVATDPAIGLALIHLPLPHPPAIYSRVHRAFSTDRYVGYIDSVALADRTLGELRQAMEQSGVWDRTAVLVSADHGWRIPLWRGSPEWTADEEASAQQDTMAVPFLLKLPGQSTGTVYDQPFHTIITRRLIDEMLKGVLIDPSTLRDMTPQ